MPKRKGAPAITAAQETRWRLLVRNPKFLKQVEKLNKTYRISGRVTEEQRHALGERWGIPRVPWELILYFDSYKDEASRYALYDWLGLQHGPESWSPLNIYRVQRNRLAFLMVDLEHPIDDLVELFKTEVRDYKRGYKINESSSRKRLDKISEYLRCWDLAKQDKTLGEIAAEVYAEGWPEIPATFEECDPIEPSPTEIDARAKELQKAGRYGERWSYKQAKEDLIEEKTRNNAEKSTQQKQKLRNVFKVRGKLKNLVWRNIKSARQQIDTAKQYPPFRSKTRSKKK